MFILHFCYFLLIIITHLLQDSCLLKPCVKSMQHITLLLCDRFYPVELLKNCVFRYVPSINWRLFQRFFYNVPPQAQLAPCHVNCKGLLKKKSGNKRKPCIIQWREKPENYRSAYLEDSNCQTLNLGTRIIIEKRCI